MTTDPKVIVIGRAPELEGSPVCRSRKNGFSIFYDDARGKRIEKATGIHIRDVAKAATYWERWKDDHKNRTTGDRDKTLDSIAMPYFTYLRTGTPGDKNDGPRANAIHTANFYDRRIKAGLGSRTLLELEDGKRIAEHFTGMLLGTSPVTYRVTNHKTPRKVGPASRHCVRNGQSLLLAMYEWNIKRNGLARRFKPAIELVAPPLRDDDAKPTWDADTAYGTLLDEARLGGWELYGYTGLGLFTMQRPWLFSRLTRSMVDLKARIVFFKRIKSKARHKFDRKNVENINMTDDLHAILVDVMQHTEGKPGSYPIFGEVKRMTLDRRFRDLLRRLGLDGSTYWMKHTAITVARMPDDGGDPNSYAAISEVSGVSETNLRGSYTHTDVASRREVTARVMPKRRRTRPKLVANTE